MTYDKIITGGTVHSDTSSFKADIGIKGETIVAIGADLKGTAKTEIINARGKDVIPGCIDVHVHLALPFCGTVSCDDFDSGSRAAACGCITMVCDFAIPGKDQTLEDAHRTWLKKSKGISAIDFSWHMAITNKRHIKEIPAFVERGLPTFKEFMIYESEGWNSDDAMLYATLEKVRRHNGMLLLHAESPRVLDLLIERAHTPAKMKKHGARLHAMTRPNFIEAEAIERAVHWCDVTGGRLYIVHMSTGEGCDIIRNAQSRGVPVLAETCIQYLTMTDERFKEKDGHLYACCPQIKKAADVKRLWEALEYGNEVSVISTDTCSFTREQKAMWEGDFTKIPMGLPGLDTMVPLVYTHGVRTGRLTINDLVRYCSTAPAIIMGMGHRKGRIEPGYDADIAIIDPKRTVKVDWKRLQSRSDWSPWQGEELGGFAHTTLCRGEYLVKSHRFVGKRGHGKLIPRMLPGA